MIWFKANHKPVLYLRCPTCNSEAVEWGRLEWTDEGARLVAKERSLPELSQRAQVQSRICICPSGHPVVRNEVRLVYRSYSVLASTASGKSKIVQALSRPALPDRRLADGMSVIWLPANLGIEGDWTRSGSTSVENSLTCRKAILNALKVRSDELNEFLSDTGATEPRSDLKENNSLDHDAKSGYSKYDEWGGNLWPLVKRMRLTSGIGSSREATVYVFDLQGELAEDGLEGKGRINPLIPGQVKNTLFVMDGALLVANQLTDKQLSVSTRPVSGGQESHTELQTRVNKRLGNLREHLNTIADHPNGNTTIIVLSKADAIRATLAKAKENGQHGLAAWEFCFGIETSDIISGARASLHYLLAQHKSDFLKILQYEMPTETSEINEDALDYIAENILRHVADPAFFWAATVKENSKSKFKVTFPDAGNPLGSLRDLELPSFADEFFDALLGYRRMNVRDLIAACIIGAALAASSQVNLSNFSYDWNFKFVLHCACEFIDGNGNPHSEEESHPVRSERCTVRLLQHILDDALEV